MDLRAARRRMMETRRQPTAELMMLKIRQGKMRPRS